MRKTDRSVVLVLAVGMLVSLGNTFAAEAPASGKADSKTSAAKPEAEAGKKPSRTVFAARFENVTGEEQYEPAAAGMGDLVAVMLGQHESIAVVERQWLAALAEEQARSLQGLTGQEYAVQAGKLLKADTVLTGRLFLVDGKLTVSIKAIDVASERVVAADQISFRPVDLAETALQSARKLAEQMALPLPKIELKDIDKAPIASLHFGGAMSHYYAGNMDAAIMEFMRTMDLDPDFVEAHYWMGVCYHRLGEDDHAVIEWEQLVKRCPNPEVFGPVRKLLAEAKAQVKKSTVIPLKKSTVIPLGPETEPAGASDSGRPAEPGP